MQNKKIITEDMTLPLGWVISILVSISAPIVILESTSTTFIPGTRSPMISQIWQPLLYLTFIYLFCKYLPFNANSKKRATLILISFFTAIIFSIAIDYNHTLKHVM